MEYTYSPKFRFNLQTFIDSALQLIECDEPLRAINLLDNLPAYYRDAEPKEVSELKKEIYSKIFTHSDYAKNKEDFLKPIAQSVQALHGLARGQVIFNALKERNAEVHIVDFGPGDYWLPLALDYEKMSFTYDTVCLQREVNEEVKRILEHRWRTAPIKGKPTWFVAYEVIEHLKDPFEIYLEYSKLDTTPEQIFFSTPLYTFLDGNPNWRQRGLPHLKAYTPKEFINEVHKLFPNYKLEFYHSEVMVVRGILNA